jgi:hypothetical protein
MGACRTHFFNDRVAILYLDDPLVRTVWILMSDHEDESARVFAHALVLLDAEHHRLEAAWIGAFAEERHPVRGPEAIAVHSACHPFIRSAESRLIRRELVGTPVLVEHDEGISAAEEFHTLRGPRHRVMPDRLRVRDRRGTGSRAEDLR